MISDVNNGLKNSRRIGAGEDQSELIARASFEISRFSTMLAVDGEFAGSGTFVKCGGKFGILTANHVVHNPEDPKMRFDFNNMRQILGIVVEDIQHGFRIEMGACQCLDIGAPSQWGEGPDLSVVLLPEVRIGTLKAKKDFYDLDHKTGAKLTESLKDDGIFVVAGAPGCKAELIDKPQPQQGDVLWLSGFLAQAFLKQRYSQGRMIMPN